MAYMMNALMECGENETVQILFETFVIVELNRTVNRKYDND